MPRKQGKEAKAERLTWFGLVMVFIILSFDENLSIPDYLVPFIIAGILLISGLYQLRQRWPISPVLWITMTVMILAGLYGIYFQPFIDLRLVSLIAVVILIGFGVLTNES